MGVAPGDTWKLYFPPLKMNLLGQDICCPMHTGQVCHIHPFSKNWFFLVSEHYRQVGTWEKKEYSSVCLIFHIFLMRMVLKIICCFEICRQIMSWVQCSGEDDAERIEEFALLSSASSSQVLSCLLVISIWLTDITAFLSSHQHKAHRYEALLSSSASGSHITGFLSAWGSTDIAVFYCI